MFLIPIPFLFYVQKERKAILFINNNEELTIINGENQLIWVLMAGGNSFTNENRFELK
jgi:hypothetical protein